MLHHVRCQRCVHLFILFQLLSSYSMATLNFVNAPYNFSIQENEPIGTFLGNISAISSGLNPVTYHIANQSIERTFSLELNSGILWTNSSLDFEARPSYQLSIEARAGTQSAFTTVIVSVSYSGTKIFRFCAKHYLFMVRLSTLMMSVLFVRGFLLQFTSQKTHPTPLQTLSSRCPAQTLIQVLFTMISLAGTVSTKFSSDTSITQILPLIFSLDQMKFQILNSSFILFGALNYSETSNYSILIAVSDNSTPSLHIRVFVQVLPNSDLPPVFTQDGKYNLQLSEDAPIGPIYQVF